MFTQQTFPHVIEGMEVYNPNGHLIGTVDEFRVGVGAIRAREADTTTIIETVSESLGWHKTLPTIIYAQLYDQGYIRIKRGLFHSDLLILSKQVYDANEISLHLNVDECELIRI